ncbi:MAG: PilZ domain-containing protein [Acidobacteria bacterium]|nr:PilZ domain-containing protein [Acidobacteriota bacterium]
MELDDKRRLRYSEGCICDSEERSFPAQFQDLSLDGAYIGTPQPFPVGHRFRLRFTLQGKLLVVPCVVRHINPGTGMGVKFLSLPPEHRQWLARHFNRVLGTLGEPAHTKKRRASRLTARIPVTVSGIDTGGKGFEEDTETLNVSERGACIRLRHAVEAGATLKVKTGLGPEARSADFRVVWQGPAGSPTEGQAGLMPSVLDLWRGWNASSWATGNREKPAAEEFQHQPENWF